MDWSWLPETGFPRAVTVLAIALLIHLLVRGVKSGVDRVLGPPGAQRPPGPGRHPKLATILSLTFSAATFVLWFVAVGLVLAAFAIDPTTYFATATVIGLAVGFGSQGLVQDVVIGLTLIFTDAIDVGETVEVSGQVGRVRRMGLRFTTLTNFLGQTVFIPNRNIAVVGRYHRGVVRAYIDVQVPDGVEPEALAERLLGLARGLRRQHPAAVVSDPEIMDVAETPVDAMNGPGTGGRVQGASETDAGERGAGEIDAGERGAGETAARATDAVPWRYVRLKLRIWPGQQPLVETIFRQRVIAYMKTLDEKYADWMVPVTYRV